MLAGRRTACRLSDAGLDALSMSENNPERDLTDRKFYRAGDESRFAEEAPDNPAVFGLTTNIHTYNPLRIASHEYAALWRDLRQAPSWGDRWRYLFYPPGWSPDGSSQTAEELRAALLSDPTTPSQLEPTAWNDC